MVPRGSLLSACESISFHHDRVLDNAHHHPCKGPVALASPAELEASNPPSLQHPPAVPEELSSAGTGHRAGGASDSGSEGPNHVGSTGSPSTQL